MSESGTSSNTKHSLLPSSPSHPSSSFSRYGCVRCRKIIHCYRHEEGPHYVSPERLCRHIIVDVWWNESTQILFRLRPGVENASTSFHTTLCLTTLTTLRPWLLCRSARRALTCPLPCVSWTCSRGGHCHKTRRLQLTGVVTEGGAVGPLRLCLREAVDIRLGGHICCARS